MNISLKSVGVVKSTRSEIKDDNWDIEVAYVELENSYSADSLKGLDSFSHAEIIFYMDKVKPDKIESAARRPRNNPEWPEVGIFSQRSKNRPNQIGHTICRIKKVEGNQLHLEGLDAIDGTPVLDIKPWVKEFSPRGEVTQPKWISELMTQYWS